MPIIKIYLPDFKVCKRGISTGEFDLPAGIYHLFQSLRICNTID
jgi:hypothetical protein